VKEINEFCGAQRVTSPHGNAPGRDGMRLLPQFRYESVTGKFNDVEILQLEQFRYDIEFGNVGNVFNVGLVLQLNTLKDDEAKVKNEPILQLEHEKYVRVDGTPLIVVKNVLFEKLDAVTPDKVQK
jgi:hypothetical protein